MRVSSVALKEYLSAGMSSADAKQALIEQIEDEAKRDAMVIVRDVESQAREEGDRLAHGDPPGITFAVPTSAPVTTAPTRAAGPGTPEALVVLGIFSILGRFLPIELDASFLVAVLTVIGFAVHDTIVPVLTNPRPDL